MIFTVFIFVIILGILVFVHEFGHFIAAKKSGMTVEEFGFGFPPRLFGFQKLNGRWRIVIGNRKPSADAVNEPAGQAKVGSTIYSINWIPLGGFVRILGENNEHAEDPGSFINKGFWPRLVTLVAGVVMNVILAWVLLSVGFGLGLPAAVNDLSEVPKGAAFSESRVAILETAKDLPADRAGIKVNDTVLGIDGRTFNNIDQVQEYIKSNAGKTLVFEIGRSGEKLSLPVESNLNPPPGEGPTGIVLAMIGKLKYPWYLVAVEGAKTTWNGLSGIVQGLYHLIASGAGFASLGGPVKIAKLTGEVAGLGLVYLMQFTAFLSLNLAVLNILPFPALDGGRVLFLMIEKVRGKRNNQKIEQMVNAAGFILLLGLMVLITIKDVRGL